MIVKPEDNTAKGQTAGGAIETQTVPRNPGAGVVDNSTTTDQRAVAFGGGAGGGGFNSNQGANAPELTPEEEAKVTGPVFNPEGEAVAFQPNGEREEDPVAEEVNYVEVGPTEDNTDLTQEPVVPTRQIDLFQNILHNYASHTYRLSWFALTKEDYSTLTKDPVTFVPSILLVQSGGGQGEFGRHPDFATDFQIDNLRMTTVVGLNADAKASNAISIAFDIYEPYGMTLLDRIISVNQDIGSQNYLTQPYLLQIDFLGNASDEDNTGYFRIDQKRFAIKFQKMTINPGENGTTYGITAIPYNHQAFQQTYMTVPVPLSVEADTIGKFFDNENDESKVFKNGVSEETQREFNSTTSWGNQGLKPEQKAVQAQRLGLQGALVKSFPAAFNNYWQSISGPEFKYKQTPVQIKFKVDPKFVDSKISVSLTTETRSTPMARRYDQVGASWKSPTLVNGKTVQVYQVAQGTNIVALIDKVMQKSSYIIDQIKQFEEARESGENLDEFKFLDWYKIIPQLDIREFDNGEGQDYSKTITYSIVPYRVANAYHPDFKKTKITKKDIVRTYNYRYTGLNSDIINLDINFDSAYYTQMTTFRKRKAQAGAGQPKRAESGSFDNENKSAAVSEGAKDLPTPTIAVGSDQSSSGQLNKADDFDSSAIADLAKSLYTTSAGDMLTIRMRIIGDPAFIKQDDVYWNPAQDNYKDNLETINEDTPITNQGQIIFDAKQVFVQLIINSATDIDDDTGIINPNKKIKLKYGQIDSTFSGAFKVLKVDNNFSGGQFTQELTIIKMPNSIFESGNNPDVKTEITLDTTDENEVNFIEAEPVESPEPQQISNALGIQPEAQNVPEPVPETTQQPNNVFGIQGNNISQLQQANNNPDDAFPIVNGAGTTPTTQQPTQVSPVNIDESNIDIPSRGINLIGN